MRTSRCETPRPPGAPDEAAPDAAAPTDVAMAAAVPLVPDEGSEGSGDEEQLFCEGCGEAFADEELDEELLCEVI